ncbi:MAG: NPCBM/NEW2 domain-containing protein [Sedimentisphaerales bacterium]|nr:NPCBM/NEW2 domain-containing protein [Sedimentisphaerales bacterium]MBN2843548.1 NPCBM/NEW2 domain-containing protein [Sedimentisphaerales bacterium]
MTKPDKKDLIEEIVLKEYEGQCSPEEFAQLNELLASDPSLVEYYLEYVSLCAVIDRPAEVSVPNVGYYEAENLSLTKLCQALAESELHAEPSSVQIGHKKEQNTTAKRIISPRQRVYNFPYYSVLSLIVMILLGFSYLYTQPRHIPRDVATVVDTYQVKWADPAINLSVGDRLFDIRENLHLARGVLKLRFDNGAQVVLEAPAEFAIDQSLQMWVKRGKVCVFVPDQALGFRVNTPNCSVIDLGTEFGIDVNRGLTSVHMIKGKASLVTNNQGRYQGKVLHEKQASKVDLDGQVKTIEFQDNEFVRDFSSQQGIFWAGESFSLVSAVLGGNGFDKPVIDLGIDHFTGNLTKGNDEIRRAESDAVSAYVSVPNVDFVDGVFVPDGGNGPVQINSAGDVYDGFGDTDGLYYMAIGSYNEINMYVSGGRRLLPLQLNGMNARENQNLCIHANSGITFDLDKIRKSLSSVEITAFTSLYGVSQSPDGEDKLTNFFVFVDGQPRMVSEGVSCMEAPRTIEIKLDKNDRFLTLACTQGEHNNGDWSLFVNPKLELDLSSSQ